MGSDRFSWTTGGDTAQFGNWRRSLQLHSFILIHFHLRLEISRLPALLMQGYKSLACVGTMKDSRAAIPLQWRWPSGERWSQIPLDRHSLWPMFLLLRLPKAVFGHLLMVMSSHQIRRVRKQNLFLILGSWLREGKGGAPWPNHFISLVLAGRVLFPLTVSCLPILQKAYGFLQESFKMSE